MIERSEITRIQYRDVQKVSTQIFKKLMRFFNCSSRLKGFDFEFSNIQDKSFVCDLEIPPTFEELNINGCREVSEKALINLAKSSGSLKRIEFYWNCRITDFGIQKLIQANP